MNILKVQTDMKKVGEEAQAQLIEIFNRVYRNSQFRDDEWKNSVEGKIHLDLLARLGVLSCNVEDLFRDMDKGFDKEIGLILKGVKEAALTGENHAL